METKVTELEMKVLDDIAFSDFSTDGHGLGVWIDDSYFSVPMSQVRALLTTLSAKGIVAVSPPDEYERMGWVSIRDDYAIKSDDETNELVKETGYKLVNLEVN